MPAPPPTLKKRRDFLACARARRWAAPGLILQGRKRREDEDVSGIRVGYTCSRKVGNAVTRNRAKRRLRASAAAVMAELGRDGWDYVLVGRAGSTVSRPFGDLLDDLRQALARVHTPAKAKR